MDVVDKIERGELDVLVCFESGDELFANDEKAELLRLAKLGRAFEAACAERFAKENKCWNINGLNRLYKQYCQLQEGVDHG